MFLVDGESWIEFGWFSVSSVLSVAKTDAGWPCVRGGL